MLPKFYLASDSPRRIELLRRLGLPFECVKRGKSETPDIFTSDPAQFARLLAIKKVKSAILPKNACGIVLGFDTIVYIDSKILGKPRTENEARKFLRMLSGKWHTVHTGLAAMSVPQMRIESNVESTRVKFSELSDEEIDAYIASGEPMDKAGAYGIQKFGALLVEKVDGCFYNVVGLPLLRLTKLLEKFKIERLTLIKELS